MKVKISVAVCGVGNQHFQCSGTSIYDVVCHYKSGQNQIKILPVVCGTPLQILLNILLSLCRTLFSICLVSWRAAANRNLLGD
jgi:hypothetical protein